MSKKKARPVDEELAFLADEIIVSKTDLQGRILYANDVFCRAAEMSTDEVLGQPHNIIRHPDMPRAVFNLLWKTLGQQQEIFAYIKNMSATGKYYWVIAHVTPTVDASGKTIGYHSNRRAPSKRGVSEIRPLYQKLLDEEARYSSSKQGLAASSALLGGLLAEQGKSYAEFIWSTGK
ncbi:MAG: PAS domain-containing protein [Kordiimonadaceae bacterium]|nr:PAS domain-containing protein [Kordiimonadaceae bacterium]